MAVDFVCGFECRQLVSGAAVTPDENHWDSNAAAGASISTTTVRSGTAALRCNTSANTANINKTIARNVVAGRFYFRAATFPQVGDTQVHIVNFLNANGNLSISVDSTGQLMARAGTGSYTNVGSPMSTGQWYRVDFLADTSAGTAHMKVRLDGGTETDATGTQTAANMTNMRFGTFVTSTADMFLDDLILGTSSGDYPFGAGTVERMKPTRDSGHSFTTNDFGYNTGGATFGTGVTDVYTYLDDDDFSSTADLIRQAVVRSTGYVQVGFGTAPFTYDAQAVNVVSSFHSSTTGANTFGLKMNDGGTVVDITDAAGDGLSDISQVTIVFAEKVFTAAPSGGAWTKTKLDAVLIRGGYSTDVVGVPYWDGVMLEVAYLTPAGTSASAGVATATGDAPGGTDAIVATPAVATTTGLANNPTARPGISTTTGVATGTGAALNATTKANANLGVATATGESAGVTAKVRAQSRLPYLIDGTGTAYDATVTTAVATTATAQVATGTGTALDADGLPGTRALAGAAAATGAAADADGAPSDVGPAELATATGTAQNLTAKIAPTLQVASATGAARDANVTTLAAGQATNELAEGTGLAQGTDAVVAATTEAAGATGTAHNATVTTLAVASATAQVATATGTAHNATGLVSGLAVSVTAGVGTGTGTAWPVAQRRRRPRPTQGYPPSLASRRFVDHVKAYAELAQGFGRAYDAHIEWDDDEAALILLLMDAA